MEEIKKEFEDLITIKTFLKGAINEKGGTITDETPFSEYPNQVRTKTGNVYDTLQITKNGRFDTKEYKNAHVMVLSNADIILKGLIDGTATGLEIPATIENVRDYLTYYYNVSYSFEDINSIKSIGKYAFAREYDNNLINKPRKELYLPNCEIVKDYAFQNTLFSKIDLPNCKEIGTYAFGVTTFISSYFTDTIEVNLPNCEIFGSYVFYNSIHQDERSLLSISLPKCTTLKENAFNETPLKSFYFPLIIDIPNRCFRASYRNGVAIENIRLSNHFPISKTIGVSAFENNKNIKTFIIDTEIESIGNSCFTYCSNLNKLILNDKVKTIGNSVINGTAIENIEVPASVESIGSGFYSSKKVTYRFLSETPCTISSSTFYKSYLNKIYVPLGRAALYKSATNWSNFADYIVEPNNVTINVPSNILNNENFVYSLDNGKTYQQFTSATLSLSEIGSINFKSLTADTTILIGTTAGGNDIGTIANSELIYSTSGDTTIYLTIQ